MILFGWVLIFLMFLLCALLCGQGIDYAIVRWDSASAGFVFLGILLHVYLWGRPYFLTGLKAILRLPETGDAAISDYFRSLTRWSFGVGIVGMALGLLGELFLMRDPDTIGGSVAISIFTFSYAGWLAVMVFWPISARYAIGLNSETESKRGRSFGVTLLVFGIVALALLRGNMASVAISLTTPPNASLTVGATDLGLWAYQTLCVINPGDLEGTLTNYLFLPIYWDTPSLLLILVGLLAFRVAAGKLKSHFDWVPIGILIGVLWSLDTFTVMLSDLDPEKYDSGCMVTLLTALYGIVAAVFFAIGNKRLPILVVFGLFGFIMAVEAPQIVHDYVHGQIPTELLFVYFLFLNAFLVVFLLVSWDGLKNWYRKRAGGVGGTPPQPPEKY